jgi:hypothetical protein
MRGKTPENAGICWKMPENAANDRYIAAQQKKM